MATESARWLDLVSEMHTLTFEEARLHEVTREVRDLLDEGRTVVHGPWTPAECQSVLIPWLTVGWIELIADAAILQSWNLTPADWQTGASAGGAFLVLTPADASALLGDPTRWRHGTADGAVMLCPSQEGQARPFSEWARTAGQD